MPGSLHVIYRVDVTIVERMHCFIYELRCWEDRSIQSPEDVQRLLPVKLNEVHLRLPEILDLLPRVTAVGSAGSGIAITMDAALDITPGGGRVSRITDSEPFRINLGDPTP